MSSSVAPSRSACFTIEFMKMVHRDPMSRGARDSARGVGQLLGREREPLGEGLEERPAARRARFVDVDPVERAAADEQRLHVLAADVEHEGRVGREGAGRAQMRLRLDEAAIDPERRTHEVLAVAGGCRRADDRRLASGERPAQRLEAAPARVERLAAVHFVRVRHEPSRRRRPAPASWWSTPSRCRGTGRRWLRAARRAGPA